MPLPWLIPAIATAANLAGTFIGQGMQRRENRRARRYNSPKAQMQRYRDAGLNPNLIYSQGTPGNYGTPIDYQQFGNVGSSFLQASQTSAQTELTQAKEEESRSKKEVLDTQKDVLAANPYLNEDYVKAMVKNMTAIATIKDQEARFKTSVTTEDGHPYLDRSGETEIGFIIMDQQLQLLFQKYDLNQVDKKIKAQVIESKGFENDLKQIQRDWMKNGDITPQHIYQGIMMILQKMM